MKKEFNIEDVKQMIKNNRRSYSLCLNMLQSKCLANLNSKRTFKEYEAPYLKRLQEINEQFSIKITQRLIKIGTEESSYYWTILTQNPNFAHCYNRAGFIVKEEKLELEMKKIKMDEVENLYPKLDALYREAHLRFDMLQDLKNNEMEEAYTKFYYQLYDDLQALGVIMLSEDEVQIVLTDGNHLLWNRHIPNKAEFIRKDEYTIRRFL